MAEAECVSCQSPFPFLNARPDAPAEATCARCGAPLSVEAPTGPETVALTAAPAPTPDFELPFEGFDGPIPTGTAVLIPDQGPPGASRGDESTTVPRAGLVIEGASATPFPLIGPRTLVGRRGTHVVVADPTLSASHFVIEAVGDRFVIRDLDSSNGTRVNGHPVQSVGLEDGDRIDAGRTHFVFRVESPRPEP